MAENNYPIYLSDGVELGVVFDVSANSVNTALSSLNLLSRGARGYAEEVSENFVHLMENFANASAPANPLVGQLWYNKSLQLLQLWNGSTWTNVASSTATGLSSPITLAITGDVSGSTQTQFFAPGASINVSLPATGVTPGVYDSPTITIDAKGRITAATGGSALSYGSVVSALGYTPANDAAVVHKAGDTMTGTLNVTGGANINVSGGNGTTTGKLMENGYALIPTGMIMMWSGSATNIPGGWVICDGGNGTPNLAGCFIVGINGPHGYSVGATGGVDSQSVNSSGANGSGWSTAGHSHTYTTPEAGSHNHTGDTQPYTLQIQDMPSHNHTFTPTLAVGTGYGFTGRTGTNEVPVSQTNNTGGGGPHQHGISVDGTHYHAGSVDPVGDHSHSVTWDNRPSYYALCYIMKL